MRQKADARRSGTREKNSDGVRWSQQVRKGIPMRRVARTFGISLSVVQRWVGRAAERRLDQVDWSSQPTRVVRPQNRTGADVEALVLHVRAELGKSSDLGEHGAAAIHRTLLERGRAAPPSVRTIGRSARAEWRA